MRVFFDTSVVSDKTIFDVVGETAHALGGTLAFDWCGRGNIWQQKDLAQAERQSIFAQTMNDLLYSDVSIFDLGSPSMRIGFEVCFSLQHSKPTLVVAHSDQRDVDNLFLQGLGSSFLVLKNYRSSAELRNIVREFLDECRQEKKT